MVPGADFMDFKVSELLKEVKLDAPSTITIDRVVSSVIDAINRIPDQEVGSETAAGFIADLGVPSSKACFTFKSPETIQVGGSHSIGCVTKPELNIDLFIRMPKKCFREKDYLNHIYHAKRCLYLCVICKSLKSSPLARKIEWSTFQNEARKPVLHLYPDIELGELSEFFIRIIPTATTLFEAKRFDASRNNVRALKQGDTLPPTPHYNSSILEDILLEENAKFVKDTVSGWKNLGDALILVKVWARNRTSIWTYDCLNGYLIAFIMSYIASEQGGNRISRSMNALQIFRITLKFISSSLLEKGLINKPSGLLKLSKEDMFRHLQAFPIVLYDVSGHINLMFRVTRTAFAELQDEASWTINCMDKCKGGGFEEVFMTKVNLAAKFDSCLRINFKGNVKFNSSNFCSDNECWRSFEKDVQCVLEQGLSDRAKLVRITWKNAPSNWNVSEGFEKFSDEPMLVGLLLSSQEKSFRFVDIGPHVENSEEAAKFRKFWGKKAELRRFKDGTIAESTVWDCPLWQRHLIMKRITEYVLFKHFLVSQEDLVYMVDQLDFCLQIGDKDPMTSFSSLLEAFEALSKRLQLLDDIPLRISSVQPLHPAFRQMAVFPPEPHPLGHDSSISMKMPKFVDTCLETLGIVIQLEGSGNWPLDPEVIEKTKDAFLLKICKSLQERWGMFCTATENEVNVLMAGYAFRLDILHERSLSLLRNKAGNNKAGGKHYLDKELFLRSQHSSMINGLHGRYPSYGSVVRLAKRWVSSHLFSSFLEEEAIELLVAFLYLRPFPFRAPSSRIVGLLRFLRLLSNYDWAFSPLIVDINEDFTLQDEWAINENFILSRKTSEGNAQILEPAMFLATTYDKTSEAWTKFSPNVEVLRRMASYARSGADLLTKLILQGQAGPYTWECLFRTPMDNYDAVVLLHRDKLPHPRRLLFPSETSLGKLITQGRGSKEFQPFLQLGGTVRGPGDARSKLLVNFDPSRFFVQDLEEELPGTFEVWHDALGSDAVGLTWASKKRKGSDDDNDRKRESTDDVLRCVGEVGKGFVRSVHLLKAPRLQA